MSKLLIAILLLASIGWLMFAHKSVSQETNTHVAHAKETTAQDYVSQDIVIKDNAIQPPATPVASSKTMAKPLPVKPKVAPVAQPANTPTTGGYNGRTYSKEEVQQLIRDYSARYGISSETPLCIARNESGFNQFSKNRHSTASGVFQYLTSTWRGTDEGRAGLSVFDADANVRAAVKYMAIHKSTQPWVVRGKCPAIKFL